MQRFDAAKGVAPYGMVPPSPTYSILVRPACATPYASLQDTGADPAGFSVPALYTVSLPDGDGVTTSTLIVAADEQSKIWKSFHKDYTGSNSTYDAGLEAYGTNTFSGHDYLIASYQQGIPVIDYDHHFENVSVSAGGTTSNTSDDTTVSTTVVSGGVGVRIVTTTIYEASAVDGVTTSSTLVITGTLTDHYICDYSANSVVDTQISDVSRSDGTAALNSVVYTHTNTRAGDVVTDYQQTVAITSTTSGGVTHTTTVTTTTTTVYTKTAILGGFEYPYTLEVVTITDVDGSSSTTTDSSTGTGSYDGYVALSGTYRKGTVSTLGDSLPDYWHLDTLPGPPVNDVLDVDFPGDTPTRATLTYSDGTVNYAYSLSPIEGSGEDPGNVIAYSATFVYSDQLTRADMESAVDDKVALYEDSWDGGLDDGQDYPWYEPVDEFAFGIGPSGDHSGDQFSSYYNFANSQPNSASRSSFRLEVPYWNLGKDNSPRLSVWRQDIYDAKHAEWETDHDNWSGVLMPAYESDLAAWIATWNPTTHSHDGARPAKPAEPLAPTRRPWYKCTWDIIFFSDEWRDWEATKLLYDASQREHDHWILYHAVWVEVHAEWVIEHDAWVAQNGPAKYDAWVTAHAAWETAHDAWQILEDAWQIADPLTRGPEPIEPVEPLEPTPHEPVEPIEPIEPTLLDDPGDGPTAPTLISSGVWEYDGPDETLEKSDVFEIPLPDTDTPGRNVMVNLLAWHYQSAAIGALPTAFATQYVLP